MSEKDEFVLQSKKFKENTHSYWRKLRNDDHFSDVTLACVDKQVKSHKVVLSSSSPVLENILIQNPHPNPLIYLSGVQYSELVYLMDFVYYGEVTVNKDHLKDFLNVAYELKIKGLANEKVISLQSKDKEDIERKPPKKRKADAFSLSECTIENLPNTNNEKTKNLIKQSNDNSFEEPSKFTGNKYECDKLEINYSKIEINNIEDLENHTTATKHEEDDDMTIFCSNTDKDEDEFEKLLKNNTNSEGNDDYVSAVKEENTTVFLTDVSVQKQYHEKSNDLSNIKDETENSDNEDTTILPYQNKICKLCDFKSEEAGDLNLHRQVSHPDRYFCEQCDTNTKNKTYLKNHILAVHEGMLHNCDKCDHRTTDKSALKRHERVMHGEGGIFYFCEECDYSSADNTTFKRHKMTVHEGIPRINYSCGQCDYKASHKNRLKIHEKTKHGKMMTQEIKAHIKYHYCVQCDYKTTHQNRLQIHEKIKHVY